MTQENTTNGTNEQNFLRLMVVGVGGAGNNIVNRMMEEAVDGVEYLCMNTDVQALELSLAPSKIQLGKQGIGESEKQIREMLEGVHMVFVTCGMGGGTGTSVTPVVARIAKEMGILTVGIVTKPFDFEAKQRIEQGTSGIECLKKEVDTLIVVSNTQVIGMADKSLSEEETFKQSDKVVQQSIQDITDIINKEGFINIDFEDIQCVMKDAGIACVGIGKGHGSEKIQEAVRNAVHRMELEAMMEHSGVKQLLANISGDIGMFDTPTVSEILEGLVGENVPIILGANESFEEDTCTITVVAIGGEVENKAAVKIPDFLKS